MVGPAVEEAELDVTNFLAVSSPLAGED